MAIKKDFVRIPKNPFPVLPVLTWGDLVFKISTVAVESMSVNQEYEWVSMARYGGRKLYQFVGIGEESFTVRGTILARFSYDSLGSLGNGIKVQVGTKQLDDFYNIAGTGAVRPLIDGRGSYYGDMFIKSIRETKSNLMNTGAATMQEYEITFVRHGQGALGNVHISYSRLLESLIDSVQVQGGVFDLFNAGNG